MPISMKPLRQSAELDLEAQQQKSKEHSSTAPTAAEYDVETKTKLLYLAGYFAINLSLTIYNKAVLGVASLPMFHTFSSLTR